MANLAPLNPFKTIKKITKIGKKLVEQSSEVISHDPTGVVKGVKDTLAEQTNAATQDMWKQILMPSTKENGHNEHGGPVEMHAGEEIDLSSHDNKAGGHGSEHGEASEHTEPHINYRREILHYRESINSSENRELNQKVNEIMVELKRLIDSTTTVSAELYAVAVSETPAEVGKYHLNFFEWMLVTLQTARMKVEDSGAWLSAMSSKKGKKDYWGMFKKHGTSFGMSNERQVATQTG